MEFTKESGNIDRHRDSGVAGKSDDRGREGGSDFRHEYVSLRYLKPAAIRQDGGQGLRVGGPAQGSGASFDAPQAPPMRRLE